eukprot:COSAG02_NODE_5880_length_3966_cov_3.607965_2_plen_60_part_00
MSGGGKKSRQKTAKNREACDAMRCQATSELISRVLLELALNKMDSIVESNLALRTSTCR